MAAPVITFLSDYGLQDDFVGVCHGVIARISPEARVIDITHGVPSHDPRAGALILREAVAYMPPGIHLAVVDPDVGSRRRALALEAADGRRFVGPDNGLLIPAAEAFGGVSEAVDIGASPFALAAVSATFHGRDLFAPVAARLASGASLAEAGEPCAVETLISLALPRARTERGALIAHALYIDRFGNVQLDAGHDDLAGTGLEPGRGALVEVGSRRRFEARVARTFADVAAGDVMLYEDAYRRLAVAVSHGSAATALQLAIDDELRIRPK